MSIFLGIDGGGTSCKALCCDEHGVVLWEGRGGPTNWTTTPRETFIFHLEECLAGCPSPDAIAGCFAGILGPEDSFEVESLLISLYPQARVVAEADYCAAFFSCSPGTDACIIAGTGSVVVSRSADHWLVGGGGGALLGDVGSAFDLVRLGVRKLVYEGLTAQATSPFGRGRSGLSESDSDLSARPGEGIGNSGYPLPNPLPEGEGAISGVHNSSPPEGEVPRYEAEGVSNFEGITPPPSSHSASLTQSHLLPKEEDLHIQSPSLGEGEVRGLRGQGAGSVESTEPSSVHPPHPSPLPLGSGGSLPHLAAALKAKFGTLERGPLTRAIYACASPQAELGGMIGVLGQDVAESEELQHEVNEHFRPLLETACRLTTAREIGLVGGVWDAHPIFLDLITDLTKVLNVPYENVTISKTDASPAMGAVRLAMKLHSNEYRRS